MSLGQVRAIIRSVGDLPDDLGPELTSAAEVLMLGHCKTFDPATLALIGRRLAECIDPEGTQARDEKTHLEREKTAHSKRGLTLSADKDGAGRHVRGYLNTEGAAIIAAALDGLSAPIPDTAAGDRDTRSPAQRRHDALIDLDRHQLQAGQLPATGGIKPRIVITIPLSSLQARPVPGGSTTEPRSPPSLSAYLGCDAENIPAFTDGDGNLINLGRARRTFTGPARLALELRDRGLCLAGLRSADLLVCSAPRTSVESERPDRPEQRRAPVWLPPPRNRKRRLASLHPARPGLVPPANLDRPDRNPSSTPCTTHHPESNHSKRVVNSLKFSGTRTIPAGCADHLSADRRTLRRAGSSTSRSPP